MEVFSREVISEMFSRDTTSARFTREAGSVELVECVESSRTRRRMGPKKESEISRSGDTVSAM